MNETTSPVLQKACLCWARRRERDISLRVYYDLREQDGCKVFTVEYVEELD